MSCKIIQVPVPTGCDHPEPPHPELPKHEFTMGLIAPKGSGKTTTMINLLRLYKGYFHRIIIYSPSISSDEKWGWLKKQDLLARNHKLEETLKALKQIEDYSNTLVARPKKSGLLQQLIDEQGAFDPKIPPEDFVEESTDRTMERVMDKNRQMIDFLDEKGYPKYIANRLLIICDDQVGSDIFCGDRKKDFVGRNTRHRHYGASLMIVTQGYKEIPKTIRTNWTCLLLYEVGNQREVDVIFEEFTMGLDREPWNAIYKYCVKDRFCFMYLNFFFEPEKRIWKNFEEVITIDQSMKETFQNNTAGKTDDKNV